MSKVRWSAPALADYDDQINYIAASSQKGAKLVAGRVKSAVKALAEAPTGRVGRVSGTYERFVLKTSLIIAYRIEANGDITILRVIHGARDWRDGEWPED